MRLFELLKKYTDEEIIKELKNNFEDIVDESYKQALSEIRNLVPSSEEQDIIINVEFTKDELDGSEYLSCDGIEPDEDGIITRWGLEFDNWDEWLAKEINEENFEKLNEVTILAGILWEMTFNGYSQKNIEYSREELERRAKYIDEHPEDFVELDLSQLLDMDKLLK